MQKNKLRICVQLLFIPLVTAFVAIGCIKEDFSECNKSPFRLIIKAFDADSIEVGTEKIKDVTLYIFDKNNLFLAAHTVAYAKSVVLHYPNYDLLRVVALANSKQGHQTLPPLKIGDRLETAFISLIHTKIGFSTVESPDDLFFGTVDMQTEEKLEKLIPIRRKTSSVAITARYLKEYVGAIDEDFRYVLRKSSDKLDLYGKPNGSDVIYSPMATFDKTGDFTSSVFNILSTDNDIQIDIYYQDVLQITIIADNEGKLLRTVEGRLLNVLVDFRGTVSVNVSVTPWDERKIWKEIN